VKASYIVMTGIWANFCGGRKGEPSLLEKYFNENLTARLT